MMSFKAVLHIILSTLTRNHEKTTPPQFQYLISFSFSPLGVYQIENLNVYNKMYNQKTEL